ncbi:hypothetical protein CRYUN_Cryun22dG0029600 [Craigia yunnanensis]
MKLASIPKSTTILDNEEDENQNNKGRSEAEASVTYVAKDALIQITIRLRANLFDREGAVSALVPVLPYLSVPTEGTDSLSYESRESKRHARGLSYSGGYGSSDLAASGSYGSYGGHQVGDSSAYGAYGSYSSGRGGPSG